MTTKKSFDLHNSPSHLLHRAQQIAANLSAAALKDAGLTLRQFSVLAALTDNEGISQSDLVTATGIDRSTLADMVARMETSGLIKRAASKLDARAKSVSTMAKGRKALEKAQPAVAAADTALLGLLPKTRQDSLLAGLTRLVSSAEESDGDIKIEIAPAKPAPKKKKKAAAKKTTKKSKASTTKTAAKPKKKATKKKKKKA